MTSTAPKHAKQALTQFRRSFPTVKDVPRHREYQKVKLGQTQKNFPRGYWGEENKRREFMNWFAERLEFKNLSGWYQVNVDMIYYVGGGSQLRYYYGDSVSGAAMDLYPHHQWEPWRFEHAPTNFYKNPKNAKQLLEDIAPSVGVSCLSDWYSVPVAKVLAHPAGAVLLQSFDNSLANCLANAYTNHSWQPWYFSRLSRNWWANAQNRRKYFDWLSESILKVSRLEQWYDVTLPKLEDVPSARSFLSLYGGSIFNALKQMHPDHEWLEWRFSKVPRTFWEDTGNLRRFLRHVATLNGLSADYLSQYYSITREQIIQQGGMTAIHNSSVSELMRRAFPEHHWQPWLFSGTPSNYWTLDNQLKYFEWCMQELKLQSLQEWYQVDLVEFRKLPGASFLISKYHSKLYTALASCFPDHEWQEWRFSNIANPKIWKSRSLRRKFFLWAEKELKLEKKEDWYNVTYENIGTIGGDVMLGQYYSYSVANALRDVFPEHRWDPFMFKRMKLEE